MIITCPACEGRYRIDPSASKSDVAKVKCPACKEVFEVSLKEDCPEQKQPSTGSPVVLVVDDARFFREMIKDILKDLPVELIMAADGNEAWDKINSATPQLVLLDLNIPGKNGRQILRALQEGEISAKVKVLAMSGVDRGEETASEVKAIGATDFINKSFKPIELQRRVQELLGL